MADPENSSEPLSTFARLIGVFSSPGEVFADIRGRDVVGSTWIGALLIVVLVGTIATGMMLSDPAVQQQIRALGDARLDQMVVEGKLTVEGRKAAGDARDRLGPSVQTIGGTVSAAVVGAGWIFFLALAIKLLAWFGFNRRVAYMKAVEVAGVAGMITALDSVVHMLLVLIRGSLYAAPGLNLLIADFDPENSVHQFLATVNIMSLWYLAVLAVAVATLCESGFWKSAAWVFGLWFGVRVLPGFPGDFSLGKTGSRP
jgi:hypothetical protein